MPDGTGADDYGYTSTPMLKQMAWDLFFIRDKLTLSNVSKTLIWRRGGSSMHHMILGRISVQRSGFMECLRAVADAIENEEDGASPPVESFGQSSMVLRKLQGMHSYFSIIAAKIMSGRRTFTMRMDAMAGSNVEMALGDISVAHDSWLTAADRLSVQISAGRG